MFASSLPHILNLPKALKVPLVWQALVRSCSVRELGRMRLTDGEGRSVKYMYVYHQAFQLRGAASSNRWLDHGSGEFPLQAAEMDLTPAHLGDLRLATVLAKGPGGASLVGHEGRHGPRSDK